MNNRTRGVLVVALFAMSVVGFLSLTSGPAVADSCTAQCYRDYRKCVPICSKNPCFVSCETVLEICLSNCGLDS